MSALADYIAQHLGEALTLQRLSSEVGLSEHELLIAFRARFGTTPAQYIINERIREARRRMHSRASLTAIAYEVGFSSSSHLSAVIKKYFGISTRELRSWQSMENEKIQSLLDWRLIG
ncbi:helix-turn-helix domain-containing protein [Roseibacillus ishigakijimensis]|uniref:Helix-turn-helix transcriptional regulator n=2 Tax=Roseibacillus ishigakijimensis TaxID=454146 RepID=A0A934RTK2_9BACT|nr:helix-turn-helix transcriptional regulator [Roseibacillus ishigakijimensis]